MLGGVESFACSRSFLVGDRRLGRLGRVGSSCLLCMRKARAAGLPIMAGYPQDGGGEGRYDAAWAILVGPPSAAFPGTQLAVEGPSATHVERNHYR